MFFTVEYSNMVFKFKTRNDYNKCLVNSITYCPEGNITFKPICDTYKKGPYDLYMLALG